MARSYGMVRQPPLFVVVGARHARDSSVGAGTVALPRVREVAGSASRQRAPELFQQDACVLW